MKKYLLFLVTLVIAVSLVGGLALAGSEEGEGKKEKKGKVQEMTLYHDNTEFQEFWESFGEASGEDAGVLAIPVPLETSVYMTRVKVDLTTERAPAVFKW
ncbi:MAG: hypothetical protein KAS61_00785, partial [Spirochaetes bacterium]|nr:hypothetical protein [Spirochaetota bacterium]